MSGRRRGRLRSPLTVTSPVASCLWAPSPRPHARLVPRVFRRGGQGDRGNGGSDQRGCRRGRFSPSSATAGRRRQRGHPQEAHVGGCALPCPPPCPWAWLPGCYVRLEPLCVRLGSRHQRVGWLGLVGFGRLLSSFFLAFAGLLVRYVSACYTRVYFRLVAESLQAL